MERYLPRVFDRVLERRLASKDAVLIEGAKWCGKTSTAERQAASVLYMQRPETREQNIRLAEISPSLLLQGDAPRLIDEWQLAPKLWDAVRFEADRRQEFGQFHVQIDELLPGKPASLLQFISDTHRTHHRTGMGVGSVKLERPQQARISLLDHRRVAIGVTEQGQTFLPQDIPLDVVYEDDAVLVVNKPAGLVVHPGHGNYSGTLVNALAYYFRNTPNYDVNDPRLGLVHRIDKDTSGLLVIAKTPEAKTNLGLQFFHKTTQRKYVALVWGLMEHDEGTIVGNIGRSLKDRLQMTVFPDGDQGKHAVTHYKTLERLGYVSIVECKLETGRTHQIRVHMKYIGHTLFNDERYGGDQILKGTTFSKYKQFVQNCFDICPRQALHAKTLGFKHPVTGEEMFFDSPIPQDMTQLFD